MLASLGRRLVRHPRRAIVVWAVVTIVGATLALLGAGSGGLGARTTADEHVVEGSQSAEGLRILAESSTSGPALTLMVTDVDLTDPELPDVVAAVRTAVADVPGVTSVVDPYALPDGLTNAAAVPLLAVSGTGFVMVAELDRELDDDARATAEDAVVDAFAGADDLLREVAPEARTLVGGASLVGDALTDRARADLLTAVLVALPAAFVVLVLALGGLLPAALPVAAALASTATVLGALATASRVLAVDAAALAVTVLLATGLAAGHGLLVVSRFRTELALARAQESEGGLRRRRGDGAVQVALVRTVEGAGRTVALSGAAVAVGALGLVVLEPPTLRALGVACLVGVVVAVTATLTLVPALLLAAGARLERPSVLARVPRLAPLLARTAGAPRARTTDDAGTDGDDAAPRREGIAERRPAWVLGGSVVVLAALALPVASLHVRTSGVELLPTSDSQRQFVDLLAVEYPATAGADVVVVLEAAPDDAAAWVPRVEALEHVRAVHGPSALGAYSVLAVDAPGLDDAGPAAVAAVRELRALDLPAQAWVTGRAATQVDAADALAARAPWAVALVGVGLLVVLLLVTGSVAVPLAALVTTALTLAATTGVLVVAFQHGWLAPLLGFTSPGGLELDALAAVVALGAGTTAGLRLLDLRAQDRRTRAWATVAVVVVLASLGLGGLLSVQQVAVGLAVVVVLDAILVRLLLAPALTVVLGGVADLAPGPLRRLRERLGLDA